MRSISPKTQINFDGITIQVTRKRVKNINLRIDTATGVVRVSCPNRLSDRKLQQFLVKKRKWMQKHLDKKRKPVNFPVLKYETGEVHYLWGKPCILNVLHSEGTPNVKLTETSELELRVRQGSPVEKREKLIQEMYRQQMKERIPVLIAKWESIIGVQIAEFGVKKMKTRWGSCNIRKRRIWLSLHLAKYPPEALEYVVVHEMVHLLERLHNKRFYGFMTRFLPDWKDRERLLKQQFHQTDRNVPVPASC